MIYLLDTNILIYLMKRRPPEIAQRVDVLPVDDRLAMSYVTWAELLQGAERSSPASSDGSNGMVPISQLMSLRK